MASIAQLEVFDVLYARKVSCMHARVNYDGVMREGTQGEADG